MNPSVQIEFFGATDIGKVRINNEDTYIAMPIWDEYHILLVVIDGMGGEDGGEIASDIARETIIKYLADFHEGTPLNLIKRAVADANNEIVRQKEVQPKYARMGCVATAGIVDIRNLTLSIAHVGDSRLYRFSNGELTKLTHDHSMVGYQEEQGILTEQEAMKHPRRSIIERCLGEGIHLADDASFIDGGVFPLIEGDKYLFCSDGLSDVLSSAEIADVLKRNGKASEICKCLLDEANNAGGKDNITVVYAKIIGKSQNDVASKTNVIGLNEKANKDNSNERNTNKKFLIVFLVIAITLLICLIFGHKFSKESLKATIQDNFHEVTIAIQDSASEDSIISQKNR